MQHSSQLELRGGERQQQKMTNDGVSSAQCAQVVGSPASRHAANHSRSDDKSELLLRSKLLAKREQHDCSIASLTPKGDPAFLLLRSRGASPCVPNDIP